MNLGMKLHFKPGRHGRFPIRLSLIPSSVSPGRFRAAISFSVSRATNCNNRLLSPSFSSSSFLLLPRLLVPSFFFRSFYYLLSVINSRFILFLIYYLFLFFFSVFILLVFYCSDRNFIFRNLDSSLNLLFFRSHVRFILPIALNAMRL